MANIDRKDVGRGLYNKFRVTRKDGRSKPGGKHHLCEYFVLDLDHDPHARAALAAYAESCASEYPMLARDLRHKVSTKHFGVARPAEQGESE